MTEIHRNLVERRGQKHKVFSQNGQFSQEEEFYNEYLYSWQEVGKGA